jgi:hypothetical protein
MTSEVELDLYSGRPNPRFALDDATEVELAGRLARLPPSAGPLSLREGLGYRGFRIRGGSGARFAEVAVSDGVVWVLDKAGAERWFTDPDRALERWLADVARQHLGSEELDLLRHDLAR